MGESLKTGVKWLVFCGLLGLLLLPAGQRYFDWVDTGPLTGYFPPPTPQPTLAWDSLTANTFQPAFEHYLEDGLGFRTWFIRLRNQLSFSLLHETNDPNLFVGHGNQLFDSRTLYSYTGLDAVDSATVGRHVRRLRVVQDTLARRGKLLVFIAAPNKASFAPENMPAYFRRLPRRNSNYDNYTAAMRAAGINLLDLSRVVRSWKDTDSYPLFPRYGVHWSNYTAALAGDTMMQYIEQKYGHDLRDYHLKPGEVSTVPRDNDQDIENPLNLFYPLPTYEMRYPTVEYEPLKTGQRRPTALIVGDSFVWTVLYSYFSQAFDDKNSRYWFYNVLARIIAWPGDLPEGRDMRFVDRKAQYLARDIVVVMFTEYNMDENLDYGFSDDAYHLFVPYTHADSLHLQALEHQLGTQPNLSDYWWKKGIETGLSRDQLIHQAAAARYDSIR